MPDNDSPQYLLKGKPAKWDPYGLAALMQIGEELDKPNTKPLLEGKAYTREGMMKRVLDERRARALKAKYTIAFADNIYGEHLLTDEKGSSYKITLAILKTKPGILTTPI